MIAANRQNIIRRKANLPILPFILLFLEMYRVAEPKEKRHGQNVQHPPVSCKPFELIHG